LVADDKYDRNLQPLMGLYEEIRLFSPALRDVQNYLYRKGVRKNDAGVIAREVQGDMRQAAARGREWKQYPHLRGRASASVMAQKDVRMGMFDACDKIFEGTAKNSPPLDTLLYAHPMVPGMLHTNYPHRANDLASVVAISECLSVADALCGNASCDVQTSMQIRGKGNYLTALACRAHRGGCFFSGSAGRLQYPEGPKRYRAREHHHEGVKRLDTKFLAQGIATVMPADRPQVYALMKSRVMAMSLEEQQDFQQKFSLEMRDVQFMTEECFAFNRLSV
jgi:hypothetical protein